MNKVSFLIYEPDGKKFHLTRDWCFFISWLIVISVAWLFDDFFSAHVQLKSDFQLVYFGLLLVTIYFIISSFWTYEALKGSLESKVTFDNNQIIIIDKVFKISDIANLDFKLQDYYGKKIIRTYKSCNPDLSQGVSNYVSFTDSKGEDQGCYFQLKTAGDYKLLSPFINEAVKAKKMQFKDVIDLLGIENVSI